jgi:type VI protein secretion system component VasF
MSAEYEHQLEQQNEQLQQKLGDLERTFNKKLMMQTQEASKEAYTHYANLYRWIFTGLGIAIAAELFFIIVLISQNDSLSKQRDMALKQPISDRRK